MLIDDTKLYKVIITPQNCQCLQDALNSTVTWSKMSNIDFNTSKCILSVTRSKCPLISNYCVNNAEVYHSNEQSFLALPYQLANLEGKQNVRVFAKGFSIINKS